MSILAVKPSRYKYDLAICGIFHNEAKYLKEWIEFHKLVGVQYFVLYNNRSSDNFREILRPYVEKKQVEVIDWDVSVKADNPQWVLSAYNNALKRYRHQIKWLAFLDLDEFIFPVQEKNLLKFLSDYEKFGAVCANWCMYGTSNIKKLSSHQLQVECFTLRAEDNYQAHLHIKSIVRPDKIKSMVSPHFPICRRGFSQVNAEKTSFSGPFSPYLSLNKIRINHYWTRDEDFLYNVKIPRRQDDMGQGREITLEIAAHLNRVSDLAIFKYIGELKTTLGA